MTTSPASPNFPTVTSEPQNATWRDLPVDVLETVAEILDVKAPMPAIRAVTPESLADHNFAMGRRSLVDEVRAEIHKRLHEE